MIQSSQQKIVDEAITSRHSMRAYLPTPVSREDIASMLEVAARALGHCHQPFVRKLSLQTRNNLAGLHVQRSSHLLR